MGEGLSVPSVGGVFLCGGAGGVPGAGSFGRGCPEGSTPIISDFGETGVAVGAAGGGSAMGWVGLLNTAEIAPFNTVK